MTQLVSPAGRTIGGPARAAHPAVETFHYPHQRRFPAVPESRDTLCHDALDRVPRYGSNEPRAPRHRLGECGHAAPARPCPFSATQAR